ncbi:Cna B-type domain-containing protein [Lacticaseibacillus hulanensis]|uniref:Cna B-type domain-containing protein n=1 Tax=Lacticaseibacillus hulanensis TaxID=2493111 RepID=UPI000FD83A5C|nr:Cna B-type domain-containing protein [Lacticaseibacillus hulanensis]
MRWQKFTKLILIGCLVFGVFLAPLQLGSAQVAPDQIEPFDSARDMANPGDEADLFLYNVFLTGNHSADSADTEGAMAIQGSSFVPAKSVQGTDSGFNYGAMFATKGAAGTYVGQPITDRNRIALLLSGQIHNYSSSSLHVGGRDGYLVTSEANDGWITQQNFDAYAGVKIMTAGDMATTFQTMIKKEQSLNTRLQGYVAQTKDEGSYSATSGVSGEDKTLTINFTAKPSVRDPNVYVVDVEPQDGSDMVFMPQVSGLDKLIDQPNLKEIIFTTKAKKVVFGSNALYNGALVDVNSSSKAATNIANHSLFYLPNATQITNFSTKQMVEAPDIYAGASGQNADNPVGSDGSDLYDAKYFANFNTHATAVAGSVFAPQATIVFKGGNLNGYVMARNFHQRAGAEAHNFYNPWLESTDIEFTKVWADDGNRDGLRPKQITFDIYDDTSADQNAPVQTVTLDVDATGKTQTFKVDGLPKFNPDGSLIHYRAVERPLTGAAKAAYTTSVSADGLTVTNTHQIDTTDYTVVKKWQDHGNYLGKRPATIKVQLYAKNDGANPAAVTVGDPVTLSAANNWTYSWKKLPKNAPVGRPLQYFVKEVAVTGYAATSQAAGSGATITNTYTPPSFGILLQKIDGQSKEPLRGAKYRLGTQLQDGQVMADQTSQEATSDAQGRLHFTGMKWTPNQKYYIQEITAPNGYVRDEQAYELVIEPDDLSADGYYATFAGKRYKLTGSTGAEPVLQLTRTNSAMPVMPHTGGGGRTPWLLPGLISLALSLLALHLRRAKGVR